MYWKSRGAATGMIYRLNKNPFLFPDPAQADPSGLLAVGGDLSVRRLLTAYAHGAFPWYSEGQPILWWAPDPRCVILPEDFRIPRTVRRELRRCTFTTSHDRAFERVMRACAETLRPDQDGTWITPEMTAAYVRLHEAGFAHSVEVWERDALVGGLYGVRLGNVFFGESMFHRRSDASKLALVRLMERLAEEGCELVDCQMETAHILRYGARSIPRTEFLDRLCAAGVNRAWQETLSPTPEASPVARPAE